MLCCRHCSPRQASCLPCSVSSLVLIVEKESEECAKVRWLDFGGGHIVLDFVYGWCYE